MLPNNLSQIKQTLPGALDLSENSSSSQSRGLCNDKKSEQVTYLVSVVDDEIQTHSLDLHYTQIPIGKA